MSDEDHDIDIESDDGDELNYSSKNSNSTQYCSQVEKREHHNALERKRRDHLKDSFSRLKNAVPSLQAEKTASRAQILKKAAEYIQNMRSKNIAQQSIDDFKRKNDQLDVKIALLEQKMYGY